MEIENGGAEVQVYRDNELAITWTDSTPLTSGSYLVLRTNNSQVEFDDVQANEVALSYLHNDHLGSNSLMTDAAGTIVPGSQAAYLPFGDWRNEPSTANLTDLGYTGHRHNNTATNDLGLIYMNARYYLPGTGRFASADTIVPEPHNSQSYNKYSYVYNNPLKYTDPSGHCVEGQCEAWDSNNTSADDILAYLENYYSIFITGDWAYEELLTLSLALGDLEAALGLDSFLFYYTGGNRSGGLYAKIWRLNNSIG